MTYIIRDMPADNRPRERLLARGPEALSDAELLAIVLGSGTAGKNAIHLARELLANGISSLHETELTTLCRARGIGPAKAARVLAVLEMSRRFSTPAEKKPKFDASAIGAELVGRYHGATQERLGAVLLDARHRVMKQGEIFVGTRDRTLVSPRDIIRFAMLERAVAVVVYHNHPSGDPTPSDDDITFTGKLKRALETVDLELVDHLVLGAERYVSMKERKDFWC